MEHTLFRFSATINSDIYIKDPESSTIGQSIFRESIELFDEIGFEEFTFRKLAIKIGTTEATIYRYFENKHKILLYLTSWYWGYVEYRLVLKNTNIADPNTKLHNAIQVLSTQKEISSDLINTKKLFHVICNDASKSYLIKTVDDLNKYGVFYNYKKIVAIISNIILDINPSYPYPHMLVTTIIEGIHHQIYFAEHLPSLTDTSKQKNYLTEFFTQLAISQLTSK